MVTSSSGIFTTNAGLGPLQQVYKVKSSRGWIRALFGAFLSICALLPMIYGCIDLVIKTTRYGPLFLVNTTLLVLATASTIPLGFGMWCISSGLRNQDQSLWMYEYGLSYHSKDQIQIWHWPDIRWLSFSASRSQFFSRYTGNRLRYTLKSKQGATLILDDRFSGIEQFGELIANQVFPYQYDMLLSELDKHGATRLGKLTVSKHALQTQKWFFRWKAIEILHVKQGYLHITGRQALVTKAQSYKIAVTDIPNLDTLLKYAQDKTTVQIGGEI